MLRDFYTGELDGADDTGRSIGTISRLAQFDVSIALDYGRLIEVYVRYLRNEGFLLADATSVDAPLS